MNVVEQFDEIKKQKPKLDDQTVALLTLAAVLQESVRPGNFMDLVEHAAGVLGSRL